MRGVVLVGPRGAGKSRAGALLARRLALPFVDTDVLVEGQTGRSVAELLADGRFRGLEAEALASVLSGPAAVVAAGGGAVLWAGFRAAAAGWRVLWLDAAPEVLARRIRHDVRDRPSLTGAPPDVEIAGVARERSPLYRDASEARVDTSDLPPEHVVDRIENLLAGARGADVPRAD